MDRRLRGYSQGSGYQNLDDGRGGSGSHDERPSRQYLDPNQHAYTWDSYGSSARSLSADHAFHSQSPEYHASYQSDYHDPYHPGPSSAATSDHPSAMYSSPNSTTSDTTQPQHSNPEEDEGDTPSAGPPKRKRENRYKNAPPSVLSRRRAQNRASQRAYRERKEQRIRDLEILLEESDRKNQTLTHDYAALRLEYEKLLAEHHQTQQHQQHSPDDHLLGLEFSPESLGFVMPPTTQSPSGMMPSAYSPGSMPGYPPQQ